MNQVLISSNRPIHEILNPNLIDISHEYREHFEGMTKEPVGLDELLSVRKKLIHSIMEKLTQKQKQFIYSVKALDPKWDLLGVPECQHMPGIQWKLKNIHRLKASDVRKYESQLKKLAGILGIS